MQNSEINYSLITARFINARYINITHKQNFIIKHSLMLQIRRHNITRISTLNLLKDLTLFPTCAIHIFK